MRGFRYLLVMGCLFLTVKVHAVLEVFLSDPSWSFELDNRSMASDFEPRLEELGFVRRVKILLATGDYQSVLKAFSERDIGSDSASLLNLRGQVFLLEKQYDKAEVALKMAVAVRDDFAAAHKSLALLYMQTQLFDQARGHLQKTISLGVADAQVYGQLAYVNLKMDNAASAVYGYQQALYLQPENHQWQQGLLYALIQSSAVDQALSLLDEIQTQNSARGDLWVLRSQLFMQKHNYEAALQALEVNIRLNDGGCANARLAIELHFKLESRLRAAQLYEDCANEVDIENGEFNRKLVEHYLPWLIQQGDAASAQKILSVLDERDFDFMVQSNLAFQHAKVSGLLDEKDSAVVWLNKSLELNASNADALLLIADHYAKSNEVDSAKLYLLRAQQIKGYEESALLALAQLQINLSEYGSALQSMQRVLELNPTRKDVAKNIRIIKSLLRG